MNASSLFARRIPLTFVPLLGLSAFAVLYPPERTSSPLVIAGLLICFVAGLALRLWASALLTSRVVLNRDAVTATLIVRGPFAVVRHPLYTGAGLIFAAFAATLPWNLALPFLAYEGVIAMRLASHEEALLRARFGAAYDDYRARTGKFLPDPLKFFRIRWRDAAGVATPGRGLESEIVFILYGIAFAASLFSGNARMLYGGVLAASLVGGYVVKRRVPTI